LDDATAETVLDHLETCADCRKQVEAQSGDAFLNRLREAHRPGSGTAAYQGLSQDRILLTCPGCGKKLRAKVSLAGKKIRCPNCSATLNVPATPQAKDKTTLPPEPADTGAPPGPVQRPAQGEKDWELCNFLAPAQAADELGRLGPYRVLAVLGAGGMGVVYKAEDPQLKRLVALKAMLPTMGAGESARKRFLREAQAAAAINHDNIVHIYQVGEDRGAPFIAMQFLEGESLETLLRRSSRLSPDQVLRIGRETAEGLAAAHQRGLIHRDIKPPNLWLEGQKRRVKILDFGIARVAEDDMHLTQTGAIIGTVGYMAPEQASGKGVDHRSDLFSLGCVLYRMCTARMPFKGSDTISFLSALALETPKSPATVNPEVPARLSDLIMRMLAKKPEKRPQTAQSVSESLQHIEEEVGQATARYMTAGSGSGLRGVVRAIPGWSGRGRPPLKWSLGAAGGLLAVLIAGIVLFWPTPRGVVKIESNDKSVEIVFDNNGPTVKGAGAQPISLGPGEHGVHIKRGDLEFDAEKFVLKRGQTISLKVELLQGKIQVTSDGQIIGAGELPAYAGNGQDDGFKPMFNGKDLTGWITHASERGNWRVEDGILIGPGPGSHLYTLRGNYQDFHLRLKARINDGGISAVFTRCTLGAALPFNKPAIPAGYGVVINSTHRRPDKTGSLWAGLDEVARVRKTSVAPDQWFTLDIIAQKDHITVKVDGRTTADYSDPQRRYERGHIALQEYEQTRIEYSKIEISELPLANLGTPIQVTADDRVIGGKELAGGTPPTAPGTGNGTTLVVSKDGRGQFSTIQAAVQDAAPGSRVIVRPGRYEETLTISKPLEIVGDGDPGAVVIESSQRAPVVVSADSVAVRRLTLRCHPGPSNHQSDTVCVDRGKNVLIEDCDVASDVNSGFWIHGWGVEATVRRCKIHDSRNGGIRIAHARVTCDDCVLSGNNLGIGSGDQAIAHVRKSKINSNGEGVLVEKRGEVTIQDCEILENRGDGVRVCGQSNGSIQGCQVHRNHANGIEIRDKGAVDVRTCDMVDDRETGIRVASGSRAKIHDCKISKSGDGIRIDDDGDAEVSNCEVCANSYSGISSNRSRVKVSGCHLNRNRRYGIWVTDNGEGTFENCDLSDNGWGQTGVEKGGKVRDATPPAKQIEAVVAKLKELNPDFDGKVEYKAQAGHVVSLEFGVDHVTDISPVRALPELQKLACKGSWGKKGQLADLTPLKGMKLTELTCVFTPVTDLSPLQSLPLTKLDCSGIAIDDLSALRGMHLTELRFGYTRVSDLSPLKDMKPTVLCCPMTPVTDAGLVGLENMSSLRYLELCGTSITDAGLVHLEKLTGLTELRIDRNKLTGAALVHLKQMTNLRDLRVFETQVTDDSLVHLKGMHNLEWLQLSNTQVTDAGLDHLASLKKLVDLKLVGTAVTDDGVSKLNAALPECKIAR
jgi:parallel beta-helix repeat protein